MINNILKFTYLIRRLIQIRPYHSLRIHNSWHSLIKIVCVIYLPKTLSQCIISLLFIILLSVRQLNDWKIYNIYNNNFNSYFLLLFFPIIFLVLLRLVLFSLKMSEFTRFTKCARATKQKFSLKWHPSQIWNSYWLKMSYHPTFKQMFVTFMIEHWTLSSLVSCLVRFQMTNRTRISSATFFFILCQHFSIMT